MRNAGRKKKTPGRAGAFFTRQGSGRSSGRWWGGLGGCVCGRPRGFPGDDHTAHDPRPEPPILYDVATTRSARFLRGILYASWPRSAAGRPARASDSMNLVAALLGAAATTPERPALVGTGDPVSHGEVAARSARATSLLAARVAPGDRVALIAGNEPAFVTAYLATLAAGAVAVPLNPTAPAAGDRARAGDRHAHAGGRVTRARRPGAARDDARSRRVRRCWCSTPKRPRAPKPRAPTGARRERPRGAAVHRGHGRAAEGRRCSRTARCSRTWSRCRAIRACASTPTTSRSGVLPFFHVFGLNVVLDLALLAGAAVSLVDHFHPAETLDRVRRDARHGRRRGPGGVRRVVRARRRRAPADAFASRAAVRLGRGRARCRGRGADARALRRRRARGVRAHRSVARRFDERGRRREPRIGSIGPPLPGIEVRLVDTDERDVLEGDPGEIQVRGPNVFAGYWEDADATARVLDRRRLAAHRRHRRRRSRRLAERSSNGPRTSIIVSGFNVFPGEVEGSDRESSRRRRSRGDRRTASAYGRDRCRVRRGAARRATRIRSSCCGTRAAGSRATSCPTRVEVVSELPRSFTGKLLRRELSSSDSTLGRALGRDDESRVDHRDTRRE